MGVKVGITTPNLIVTHRKKIDLKFENNIICKFTSKMSHQECSVCYEPCAKLSVTCCNGHTICEKHYLQRYKAIYEEGTNPFDDDNDSQICFFCRTEINDDAFSPIYFRNLQFVILQGNLLREGKFSKDNFHSIWENQQLRDRLKKIMDKK